MGNEVGQIRMQKAIAMGMNHESGRGELNKIVDKAKGGSVKSTKKVKAKKGKVK